MKKRLYCIPGVLISFLMTLSPSFRVSNYILRLFNSGVSTKVTVHSGVRFVLPTRMKIGEGTTINSGALTDSRCWIEIGKNSMVGRGAKLFTLGHDLDDPTFRSVGSKITIGDNAVIFPYVLVMPGVTIGNNSVVLPGSVVTKDTLENGIYGGTPAKFMRYRDCTPNFSHNYNVFFGV